MSIEITRETPAENGANGHNGSNGAVEPRSQRLQPRVVTGDLDAKIPEGPMAENGKSINSI